MLFLSATVGIIKSPLCTKLLEEDTCVHCPPQPLPSGAGLPPYQLVTSRTLISGRKLLVSILCITVPGTRGCPCTMGSPSFLREGSSQTCLPCSCALSYLFWTSSVTRKLGKWKPPTYITEMNWEALKGHQEAEPCLPLPNWKAK